MTTADECKTAYDRCPCGRLMTLVCGLNHYSPEGVQVLWCAGCGVLNVHYNNGGGDETYTPRKELIGKK